MSGVTCRVAIRRLPEADADIALPSYASAHAAGMDLCANFPADRRATGVSLAPGERALVPTGIAIALPEGFEMQIRPRSGLALHNGITLVNSPGTIDADYRGEIGVILLNAGHRHFHVTHGARIAQMVLAPVHRAEWEPVEALDVSARGAGGFGSTGG